MGTAGLGTPSGEEKWAITDVSVPAPWPFLVSFSHSPPHAGIRGLTIRNSGAPEFYHYSRFSS